jgi:hypothetical protein
MVAAFFNVLWKKLIYWGLTTLCYVLVAVLEASSMGGFGFGQSTYLSFVTTAPRTTSSLKSISY